MPAWRALVAAAIARPGQVLTHRFRARHRDGGWRTLESYGRLEPGDSVLITNSRDITDRVAAEDALRRLNAELEQRVAERTSDLERSLGEQRRLAAIIEATSDYVGIADLDRIAVTHGPGTFTGVRIGVAAARALALAHGVPVVAFSSLLPLAMAAVHRIPDCVEDRDAVLVARDARREECYVEVVDAHGRSLTGPLISTPAEAAALCPEYRLFATGSAAEAVARVGRAAGRPIAVDDAPRQRFADVGQQGQLRPVRLVDVDLKLNRPRTGPLQLNEPARRAAVEQPVNGDHRKRGQRECRHSRLVSALQQGARGALGLGMGTAHGNVLL